MSSAGRWTIEYVSLIHACRPAEEEAEAPRAQVPSTVRWTEVDEGVVASAEGGLRAARVTDAMGMAAEEGLGLVAEGTDTQANKAGLCMVKGLALVAENTDVQANNAGPCMVIGPGLVAEGTDVQANKAGPCMVTGLGLVAEGTDAQANKAGPCMVTGLGLVAD